MRSYWSFPTDHSAAARTRHTLPVSRDPSENQVRPQTPILLGAEGTGSGRRESYAHIPMPRMTNTFMMAGDSDPAEIVRSVPKGLYCVNFGGGQVDITSGNFVFSASESYLIEDGKLTRR